MQRGRSLALVTVAVCALALSACGGDDDSAGGDTTTTRGEPTTTRGEPTTTSGGATTTTGGGGGGPQFTSFSASSTATCDAGNAVVTMAYETVDVVDISISIDGGAFQETAGYGPNETDVVANIPCTAGQAKEGSVQLRGCSEGGACTESDRQTVQVSG